MAATATAPITIRDKSGALEVALNLDPATHTPQQVFDHLIAEGLISQMSPAGEPLLYHLATADGQQLPDDEPIEQHGVQPGDTLTLMSKLVQG